MMMKSMVWRIRGHFVVARTRRLFRPHLSGRKKKKKNNERRPIGDDDDDVADVFVHWKRRRRDFL